MAPQTKEENHRTRINHLEFIQAQQNTAVNFAWYWQSPRLKLLAVVSRLNKDKADLVVFNAGWSGGVNIVHEVPMFVAADSVSEDEQMREGKWEPFMTLPEALEEELKKFDEFKDLAVVTD
jgi:hypothetical protein